MQQLFLGFLEVHQTLSAALGGREAFAFRLEKGRGQVRCLIGYSRASRVKREVWAEEERAESEYDQERFRRTR